MATERPRLTDYDVVPLSASVPPICLWAQACLDEDAPGVAPAGIDLQPAGHRLSEYANGPYGWMMTVAFVASA
jgi:hypothetical protein